ncbi:hypothetical protein QRQ56_24585 [Bradyrhizobium sp. U531]|uniref:hypothetical protein n=1 Tax=Bradyrhizobium sp. U531 TaxID=3053458 RepID=UPI003F4259FF
MKNDLRRHPHSERCRAKDDINPFGAWINAQFTWMSTERHHPAPADSLPHFAAAEP